MIIMITGDFGFIGRALRRELEAHDHKVVGFDVVDHRSYDVTQRVPVDAVMHVKKPDLVVHLAAEVGKLNCEQNSYKALEVNAGGTLNVAKICAEREVPLVYCSTSEVYGDVGDGVIVEEGLLESVDGIFDMPVGGVPSGPLSGTYALTKFWGEQISETYAPDGLKIIRPTMPYGPGVPPGPGRRALDNLVWQALTGQPMVVHKGAARSWCWIDDLASGFRAVIERGEPGIYNVGRDDDEVSMEDLATQINFMTHARADLVQVVDPPARQTAVKRISCAKLRALGWEPKVSLDEGLPKMVAWIKECLVQDARKQDESMLDYHLPFPGCCDAHS